MILSMLMPISASLLKTVGVGCCCTAVSTWMEMEMESVDFHYKFGFLTGT
jgi:hypothetical protein